MSRVLARRNADDEMLAFVANATQNAIALAATPFASVDDASPVQIAFERAKRVYQSFIPADREAFNRRFPALAKAISTPVLARKLARMVSGGAVYSDYNRNYLAVCDYCRMARVKKGICSLCGHVKKRKVRVKKNPGGYYHGTATVTNVTPNLHFKWAEYAVFSFDPEWKRRWGHSGGSALIKKGAVKVGDRVLVYKRLFQGNWEFRLVSQGAKKNARPVVVGCPICRQQFDSWRKVEKHLRQHSRELASVGKNPLNRADKEWILSTLKKLGVMRVKRKTAVPLILPYGMPSAPAGSPRPVDVPPPPAPPPFARPLSYEERKEERRKTEPWRKPKVVEGGPILFAEDMPGYAEKKAKEEREAAEQKKRDAKMLAEQVKRAGEERARKEAEEIKAAGGMVAIYRTADPDHALEVAEAIRYGSGEVIIPVTKYDPSTKKTAVLVPSSDVRNAKSLFRGLAGVDPTAITNPRRRARRNAFPYEQSAAFGDSASRRPERFDWIGSKYMATIREYQSEKQGPLTEVAFYDKAYPSRHPHVVYRRKFASEAALDKFLDWHEKLSRSLKNPRTGGLAAAAQEFTARFGRKRSLPSFMRHFVKLAWALIDKYGLRAQYRRFWSFVHNFLIYKIGRKRLEAALEGEN